jgi:hypothetical protein
MIIMTTIKNPSLGIAIMITDPVKRHGFVIYLAGVGMSKYGGL